MKPYYFRPGIPAAGHIFRGFWHPGRIEGCAKCPSPPERPLRRQSKLSEATSRLPESDSP